MKYATPAAFRQALDDRLKSEAEKSGLGIARLRKRVGLSGRESTRPKDLVDILLIIGTEELDAAQLRESLETTFHERATHPLLSSLPPPPEDWREPYRRLATEVDVEPELDNAYAETATCLDPILAGRTTGVWNPQRRTWR